MRALRMFTNSALGGLLGAAFVTILILQLNRHLPLDASTVVPLYVRLALFYGIHLAVGFYALILARELLIRQVDRPRWVSLRILSWLGTLVVGAAAAMMWFNFAGYGPMLDDDSARRLAAAAGATTVCAVLLAVVTVVHYSFGRRGSRVATTLLVLTLGASVLFPLAARGWGQSRPLPTRPLDVGSLQSAEIEGPQVTLIVVDGASLDFIANAVTEGRLPHFGRMLEGGAAMYLTTIRPTQPAGVWAAVATGKRPPKNGIRAAAAYSFGANGEAVDLLPDLCFAHALVHLGFLHEQPHRASALRARPLWSILGREGVPVGVVGWPITAPASPVRGFLITDRLLVGEPAAGPSGPPPSPSETLDFGYPQSAVLRARAIATLSDAAGTIEEPPLRRDAWASEIAWQLREEYRPRFLTLRYEGLDRAGHLYLRYARPREFGDVSADEQRRYGAVLQQHYAFLDGEIGRFMNALRPGDAVFVVSGFGMEPVRLGKRMLARLLGEPDVTGTHERAPDGFLLAFGTAIRGVHARAGSLVDVAPTVLYFLGLPVARDMDGHARTEIFRPAFTADRPITFIPSYER
jgi:Type I phosphodiesterase / nucleotide pyrophosphatase